MNILWIEGDKPVQDIITTILSKTQEFDVEFLEDGDVAFRHYCACGPYDLVMTDFFHPGMDGLELANAIRGKNPEQAMGVFTAHVAEDMVLSFKALHIPVLHIPAERETLIQFVRTAKQVS